MPSTPLHNERWLLQQTAEGNETAFRQLFEHYSDNIYGAAFAYTKSVPVSEEIVQDVFLKIWLGRKKLTVIERFNNYVFIIARNYILNHLRKIKKDRKLAEQLFRHFNENSHTPEQEPLFQELPMLLTQAVSTLPPQQQLVYHLRREENLSLEEIASQLKISRNTARNHLNQALKNIKAYLKNHSSDGALLLIGWPFLDNISFF